jgi:hypothetical protein
MTGPPTGLTAGEPSAEPTSLPRGAGFLARLRLEDVLLFGWLVFVEPLVFRPDTTVARGSGPDPILGLLDLVGLLAFVACLVARSQPGVNSGLMERGEVLYAVGPLFGAFAFTLNDIGEKLGLEGNLDLVPIALAIVVAILVRLLVPPLSSVQRRTLVTPFILVTSRFFGDFLSGFTDIFDLRQLAAGLTGPDGFAGTAFIVAIGSLAVLIFYVMLVFAPRQVADREGSPWTWTTRFLLFLVSLALGQTFAGLLGPG